MKKWRLVSIGLLLVTAMCTRRVQAAPYESWKGTICTGAQGTLSDDVATIQGLTCVIANGLNAVLTLFSFVGFLMFVYGAFMLMLSGGNPNGFETAKNTFTYAIFGFVLALSSFVIIQLISYFTGLNSFIAINFFGSSVETERTE